MQPGRDALKDLGLRRIPNVAGMSPVGKVNKPRRPGRDKGGERPVGPGECGADDLHLSAPRDPSFGSAVTDGGKGAGA
ncbi:MAG: hypothetical protein WA484_09745 [Solirubrobacteraceae bacterium]